MENKEENKPVEEPKVEIQSLPKYTWKCYLFGADPAAGITWQVETPPNWFHRLMQRIFFGNIWLKIK